MIAHLLYIFAYTFVEPRNSRKDRMQKYREIEAQAVDARVLLYQLFNFLIDTETTKC